MLPFTMGCGGKKDEEKKADEKVTSGKELGNQMSIAGPAKKTGFKKGSSKHTAATFAKKGREQEETGGKVMTNLKKEGQGTDQQEEETKDK